MGFPQQGQTEGQWKPVSTTFPLYKENQKWKELELNTDPIWLQYLHVASTFKKQCVTMNQEKRKSFKAEHFWYSELTNFSLCSWT